MPPNPALQRTRLRSPLNAISLGGVGNVMLFTKAQWLVWSTGLIASFLVIAALAFGKGGPDWYGPVFIVAATYCLAAQAIAFVLRRRSRASGTPESWSEALNTSRLGLLTLIAIATVAAFILVLRPWR